MRRGKGLSFYKRKKKISSAFIREIFSWIFGIVAAVFMALVLNYFFGVSTNIVGISMEPTLYNGQQVFIDRFVYTLSKPKLGDVVVFLPNGNKNSHYYVKRVVAVSGDKVTIKDGILYVNGVESNQVKIKLTEAGIAENEFELKSGEYFCIGDNPNQSEDSRSANIGPIKDAHIIGKAWLRLKSPNSDFGFIN